MEVLRTISLYAEGKDMPFLVIGGHAVNAYGISRQTGDIDLLVQRSLKERWSSLLSRLNYQPEQMDDRFARFRPDQLAAWPIDLMFVDDRTFKKMFDQSEYFDIGVAKVRVVSARHLATLKIHALKHYQHHRYAKDYNDLLMLLSTGKAVISPDELVELCEKYADIKLSDRLLNDIKRGSR